MNKIIVVGCGGIGSHLIQSLCRYLNSVNYDGEIYFIDGDKFEYKNTDRQEFPEALIGYNKAEAMQILYNKKYPELKIYSIQEYLGEDNINNHITDGCVVFSGVDNHTARYYISKRCQELDNVTFISGGNSDRLDGNVQLYLKQNGEEKTPPIENRHPEVINTSGDRSKMSCQELAQIPGGEQVIFANQYAALIMVLFYYNLTNNPKGIEGCEEVYFDGFFVKTKRIISGKPE